MGDGKKYYYLKLKDDFFDSDEMLLLESKKDGYMFTDILLKMYLKSLKFEGRLVYKENIPYDCEMLATVTRHTVKEVTRAIEEFSKLQLVEILDNGTIYMMNIQNYIGKSSTEADRKREYRRQIDAEKESIVAQATNETDVKEPTPKAESCIKLYERIVPEYELDMMLEAKMKEWMEYKVERKDSYKERGLRALLKKTKEMQMIYGTDNICALVDECMSSNWKGLIWDRLEKGSRQGSSYVQKIENRVSDVDKW